MDGETKSRLWAFLDVELARSRIAPHRPAIYDFGHGPVDLETAIATRRPVRVQRQGLYRVRTEWRDGAVTFTNSIFDRREAEKLRDIIASFPRVVKTEVEERHHERDPLRRSSEDGA